MTRRVEILTNAHGNFVEYLIFLLAWYFCLLAITLYYRGRLNKRYYKIHQVLYGIHLAYIIRLVYVLIPKSLGKPFRYVYFDVFVAADGSLKFAVLLMILIVAIILRGLMVNFIDMHKKAGG